MPKLLSSSSAKAYCPPEAPEEPGNLRNSQFFDSAVVDVHGPATFGEVLIAFSSKSFATAQGATVQGSTSGPVHQTISFEI